MALKYNLSFLVQQGDLTQTQGKLFEMLIETIDSLQERVEALEKSTESPWRD